MMKLGFSAGKNIAMKVPAHEFEQTVRFYRDVLGFEELKDLITDADNSVVFAFGDNYLWIDKMAALSQAEIWLEIVTEDMDVAAYYLQQQGCSRRDQIEALQTDFRGFWVTSPANIIHLVNEK